MGSILGEYNITEAAQLLYHFSEGKIKVLCCENRKELNEVTGMAESVLRDRTKMFAKEIVFLCREIKAVHKETVLSNQLLQSGTSIGANVHEAQYAQGIKDFISKLEIALKECYESEYWLKLLYETGLISEERYRGLRNECGTIRRMLIASCRTAKGNNK